MVQNPLSDQHPAVTVGVGADTSGFTGAIDNAIQKMGAFKGAVTVAGGALAALGAGAMVQATRQAMELESAFAEVSTLMDENANAAAVFGDDVERLSTEFAAQGGQVEVINGLYQTLSAGITDTTKATALMETAMKSATAGLSDTETAVDILTTVVNAYGLEAQEASRISDVLFETVRQGKTRYDELASTIGRIVPISSELGISFETVGAAAATLTAQGQSTDEAVTAIRQAMVQLLRPQKDLLSLINDLGFETGRALVESEGFAGALRLLNEEAEESNVELGTAFGRVRAMQAVLPLAGAAADDFRENLRLMEEAAGATDTAFQKMSDTAQFRFRQAMNELESSLSETGDQFLPFATKAADAIGTLISDFNDLNQASDGAVGAIGSVGLALGGLALVAGGPIALAIAGVGALATAYATDFGDIRSTVQRSMNDVAAIMDRTLLAMTDQTDSELGKQEAIWDGWADTVVDASGRALADGVDTFATVSVNALDLVLTELINVGDAISMVARVGRAVQQSDPERAENILDQSIERIRERHRSVIERGRERSEAHNERQRQRDLLATTNDPRIRGTDIGFQNLAGSTPLQRAQEANNAQATGASGSAAATTGTAVGTAIGSAAAGGPSFQREATSEVARIWSGIEAGDVVAVDVGLFEDLRARQSGGVTASDLGLTPEEFTAIVQASRGQSVSGGDGSASGAAAVTGVSTSSAAATFDKAVTRFKTAVDKIAGMEEIEVTGRLVEEGGQIVGLIDGRVERHSRQQTDHVYRQMGQSQ